MAEVLVALLPAMQTIDLATVTAAGEPRVAPVDGHFLKGRWYFGSATNSRRAQHLAARPFASVAHTRGEGLCVVVHGRVELVSLRDPGSAWFVERLRDIYPGYDDWGFEDNSYWTLHPTHMYARIPVNVVPEQGRLRPPSARLLDMAQLSLDDVHDLSRRALIGSGTSPTNAEPVADSIRQAEAEDLRNVGLAYLPTYCEHLRCGKIDGAARPTFRVGADAALLVDAASGFAHPAFLAAIDDFTAMARRTGTASMALTRSYSAGVVGWFVDHLARRGLVSLAFANSSALMPPWGGNRPVFGTNPLGFGAPRTGEPPIIVDMATSATARVNVVAAAQTGGPVPVGWALDADGRPTTDPQAALDGMMAPLGGAKGYGLALMVDLLAGGLTGSNFSHESSSFGDNEGGPPGVGQLFVAFAPDRFASETGAPTFASRAAGLSGVIRSQPGTRLPGDRRHRFREDVQDEGVDVPDELIARLEGYC